MTIVCLFSVEQDQHDQPENNLVGWWKEMPDLETLSMAVTGLSLDSLTDDQIIGIVRLKTEHKKVVGATEFRIETVREGMYSRGTKG